MSTTSQPQVSTLESIIAELVIATIAQRPELASRLDRAAVIATTVNAITPHGARGYLVQSQCARNTVYVADGPRCGCPDSQQRSRLCKHALAVGLFRAALRIRNERQRATDYGYVLTAKGEAACVA
jgi:hypothetical protein